jgi:hypothetical protein
MQWHNVHNKFLKTEHQVQKLEGGHVYTNTSIFPFL